MFITLFLLTLVLILSVYAAVIASYTCKRFLELNKQFNALRISGAAESAAEVVRNSPLYRGSNSAIEEPL
ncbi:8 kDa protein [Persimmon virus B]|uniref:8 kDa protein n=1 Tax=Persimmon virus B TaxID=1493829 RepID=A0A0A8JC98_9CLOS|nr:8 kDa protein [Persimmon virus B]BAQ08211.1 8 kDa protein [Persimmon virus B]